VTPATLISIAELDQLRAAWDGEGSRVAFVPTMGALHAGHLSLVKLARERADRVLVSIFVNPTQFGPNVDFERYPRTLKADLELLAPLNVDGVFLPNAAAMYPSGFQTYVHNKGMSEGLCGASRPGHFEGVLTVVLKLFNMTRPHVAVFGKKDYQQWRLIERMARDLDLRLEVLGADTLREADGLAMSSRNRYLSPAERQTAAGLSKALRAAKAALDAGERNAEAILGKFRATLAESPGFALEYAELRQQADLIPVADAVTAPAVLITAGRVGATRLIDNMEMG
jgi:pantoate--beta-alanine ligase